MYTDYIKQYNNNKADSLFKNTWNICSRWYMPGSRFTEFQGIGIIQTTLSNQNANMLETNGLEKYVCLIIEKFLDISRVKEKSKQACFRANSKNILHIKTYETELKQYLKKLYKSECFYQKRRKATLKS